MRRKYLYVRLEDGDYVWSVSAIGDARIIHSVWLVPGTERT